MNPHRYAQHFRITAIPVVFAALSIFHCSDVYGRPVRISSPEELFEMSDAVLNGKVTDIILTSERGELSLGSNTPVPIRIAEARIATLASSKGSLQGDFTLRFPVFDPDIQQIYFNGPMLPILQKGERYRFYLKKKNSAVVTVLDGEFDSGYAIHRLAQNEKDESAPLFKEEAQVLATTYFREFRPKPTITACDGHFDGSGWTFSFFTGPPLSFPSFSYDAEITIDGSRSVSQKSWIGREQPRKGSQLTGNDIGKSVRLTIEGDFSEGSFRPETGGITILSGKIDSMDRTTVSGRFVSPAFEIGSEPQSISFPRGSIASVQQLSVSPINAK